jgi:LssY-like putative type I secretion system component LssY
MALCLHGQVAYTVESRERALLTRTIVLLTLALFGAVPGRAFELPAGTRLSIRLTTRVSSKASRPGEKVGAMLIAPVEMAGRLVLPAGNPIRGTVKDVKKQGGRASLSLDFSELVDADGAALPMDTRITSIEDSRETVTEEGRIVGFKPMRRLPSPFAAFVMVIADVNPVVIGAWAVGRLILRHVQRGAIDYAPGVEMTLALEAPLEIAEPAPVVPALVAAPALSAFVEALPYRTQSAKHHTDSDVTNLLFVGSNEQVAHAFAVAGWTEARSLGLRARLRGLAALVSRRPYHEAAVSRQELESRPPDLVFQKQNNTLAKRHHVRLWRYPDDLDGGAVWVGAATHDVAIVFDRKQRAFTHRIDPRIDLEREKIVNDLQLTGQVAAVVWVDRDDAPLLADGEGDDPMETDRRMAVVELRKEMAVFGSPGPTTVSLRPPGDTSRYE